MIVVPKDALLDLLTAIQATSLDGGSLRLFQNDITPNVNTVVGDLTVANFSGYANKTIAAWNDPFIDVNNRGTILAPMQVWTVGAGAVENTIYGAYFLDSGGALVWAGRFDDPVEMATLGAVLNLVPKFQYGAMAA